MAYSFRVIQNRSKKETNDVRLHELQELRKENQKLIRENRRLRKSLEKYLNQIDNFDDEEVESLAVAQPTSTPKQDKEVCPDCQGDFDVVDLGIKVLLFCKNCKYRKPIARP